MTDEPRYAVSKMGHLWKVTYECQGSTFCYSTHDTKREAESKAAELTAKASNHYE